MWFLLLCSLAVLELSAGELGCGASAMQYGSWCYSRQKRIRPTGVFDKTDDECNDYLSKKLHFASIHNAFENSFVLKQTDGLRYEVMLGLHYNRRLGKYEWTDGTTVDYTNFANGNLNPTPDMGDCTLLLKSGKWGPAVCTGRPRSTICKYPLVEDNERCPLRDRDPYTVPGVITSPGYPKKYVSIVEMCNFTLQVPRNQIITIEVTEFMVDSGESTALFIRPDETYGTILQGDGYERSRIQQKDESMLIPTESSHVIINFTGQITGRWKFNWYTTPRPSTTKN